MPDASGSLALSLSGGGARGAYQAGVLRALTRQLPDLQCPILSGISAGAVNTAYLAAHPGTLAAAADDLVKLWLKLTPEQIYDLRPSWLARNVIRSGVRLLSGGMRHDHEPLRGMLDTEPLRLLLRRELESDSDGVLLGVGRNVANGRVRAVALSATSYSTGRSTTWVEGRDVTLWQRPDRQSQLTRLSIEHVMASSALPLVFPAVQVGSEWFGDGGIRLTAPLSPALHLGASRILTVSTRYRPARPRASRAGYPPPAQVLGVLYNSIFLDLIEEDILRLQRVNQLLEGAPAEHRRGMRVVDILVIRPSRDLGSLAPDFEPRLPWMFRHLTRGLGTRQASAPDFMSVMMFEPGYIGRLIELGEEDANAQIDRITEFLDRRGPPATATAPRVA